MMRSPTHSNDGGKATDVSRSGAAVRFYPFVIYVILLTQSHKLLFGTYIRTSHLSKSVARLASSFFSNFSALSLLHLPP